VHRASVSQSINVVYSLAGGSDYQEIIALNIDVFLTFDDNNRQRSFDVTIIDDPLFELDQNFTLELRFDPFALEPPSNVILFPNTTTVDITDNEGIIIIINTIPICLKACYNNDNSIWSGDRLLEYFLHCE
jgi:hypothetical protein